MKRFIEIVKEPTEYNELRDIIESKLTSEEVFQHHIVQGNTEKGKVAHSGTLKQMQKKIRDPKMGQDHVLVKTRHDLKTGDDWKKHMHAETYSIKNTKTGQRYSVSKYQDDKKLKDIRKAGGDHKHAAHYKDGKPLEESQDLQAKMALDDAGIPWTMKRNRITVKKKDKKKAQLAWEKSFKKGGWPSLNVEDNSPVVKVEEAFFKVKIPDIAQPTFVEAGSESQVKISLRKILRPDSMKELEVEKVTPTTMKKMYRDMSQGKEEEETNV